MKLVRLVALGAGLIAGAWVRASASAAEPSPDARPSEISWAAGCWALAIASPVSWLPDQTGRLELAEQDGGWTGRLSLATQTFEVTAITVEGDQLSVVATKARRTATLQGQRTGVGVGGTLLGAPHPLRWTGVPCDESAR